ncbi:hypothetical protein [Frigidibacter sp.]|uniref:hypothetical protein n=1 Tax=Frigidibacter sp. TaxID=2586418 RepID=UPI0027360DE3|nr:hypothetical protein [Frigidibacter sp.]MDP3338947.1 hypothetical protein [Frigidibacter sp.]
MTTKSLQARRARGAQGGAKRRGGGLGTIAVAAALAIAAPGLIGLTWQAPEPSEPAVVTGPIAGPVAPLLPAGADGLGDGQDDAAAKPAVEPAPLRTAGRAVPLPPRSWAAVRRTVIVRASAAPTNAPGDAVGSLEFPPSMSSRGSGEWFGMQPAELPPDTPGLATRLTPAEMAPSAADIFLAQATEPAPPTPRNVTATVVCPGAAGCAVQPAPMAAAGDARDITAALFPGGQLRPWASAPVPPASPQARDITRRLFPSGQARW